MEIIIAMCVSILAAVIAYISLNQEIAKKIKLFDISDPAEEYVSIKISRFAEIVIIAIILIVVFFAAYKIMVRVNTLNGALKMLLALLCMTGAACFDYREQRIPNIFPLLMALGAMILLISGLVLELNGAMDYITTSMVASVGCALVLVIASLLSKQGIGAGDIKLISALALLTGGYAVMGTLVFGTIACAAYTFFALITKRKKINSSVPFGPFLFFGYIIMLFAVGF